MLWPRKFFTHAIEIDLGLLAHAQPINQSTNQFLSLMQTEAEKLKSFTVGGSRTKLVVVGVGSGLDIDELYTMATVPRNKNAFVAVNFGSLTGVADPLNNAIRRGLYYTCGVIIMRTFYFRNCTL